MKATCRPVFMSRMNREICPRALVDPFSARTIPFPSPRGTYLTVSAVFVSLNPEMGFHKTRASCTMYFGETKSC